MKLSELAELTGATLERGSPDLEISSTAGLDMAGPEDVSFLANPKYTPQVAATRAGAVYLSEGVSIERDDIAVLRAKDAYLAYTRAMRVFFPEPVSRPFVHPSAVDRSNRESRRMMSRSTRTRSSGRTAPSRAASG